MTTHLLLDSAGDSTEHIDAIRAREPVRMAGAFLQRQFDDAVDRLTANVAALLLTFDNCLVALDDDVHAVNDD